MIENRSKVKKHIDEEEKETTTKKTKRTNKKKKWKKYRMTNKIKRNDLK